MTSLYKGKQRTGEKYISVSHHFSPLQHVCLLRQLYGFHLYVGVVLPVILFGEAVTVVQQEATAQQLHRLTQLEVLGRVILIHFSC